MWIDRDAEALLARLASEQPALVVTGPRQSGKTSLLERGFPHHRYVSLDEPVNAELAEEDGREFLARYPPPVIIDEVQYAPRLLRTVKAAVDRSRRVPGQFLLAGSQRFSLMEGVTESLAGRTALFSCPTLSALELQRHAGSPLGGDRLLEAVLRGGFPGMHAPPRQVTRFFGEYVATYLERDVRAAANVRSLREFNRFMRLLAGRSGQLLNVQALATELGVAVNTVRGWLSVLEASELVLLLEPYHSNLAKRLVKAPKLYFLDTGLACHLLAIDSVPVLRRHPLLGALFESHVAGQLLRFFVNRGQPSRLAFFRDHAGHEVDFVIPQGDQVHLVECKWSATAARRPPAFAHLARVLGEGAIASQALVSSRPGTSTAPHGLVRADSVTFDYLAPFFPPI